jgi:hypothetical protein
VNVLHAERIPTDGETRMFPNPNHGTESKRESIDAEKPREIAKFILLVLAASAVVLLFVFLIFTHLGPLIHN